MTGCIKCFPPPYAKTTALPVSESNSAWSLCLEGASGYSPPLTVVWHKGLPPLTVAGILGRLVTWMVSLHCHHTIIKMSSRKGVCLALERYCHSRAEAAEWGSMGFFSLFECSPLWPLQGHLPRIPDTPRVEAEGTKRNRGRWECTDICLP